MTRTLVTAGIVLAIIVLPYWLYLPLILFATIAFPFYAEAVLEGLLIDILYGPHTHSITSYPLGIAMTILVMVALPARTYIRFHA